MYYGPEYISGTLLQSALSDRSGSNTSSPASRYNRTVRYDWLAQHIFAPIDEVQEAATRWLWTYNNERPNMALGGLTPIQKLAMAA